MRTIPAEPLERDRVVGILENLFVIRQEPRPEMYQELQIPPGTADGEVDLDIGEEDLKIAVGKCDSRKAIGVEGISGVLNEINNTGRIPAVWKLARVVLIPKPARDPLISSSYRPISILPALSKVWEHTLKMLIERSIGRDSFHRDQYGFRRRRGTLEALDRTVAVAEECRRKSLCAFWLPWT